MSERLSMDEAAAMLAAMPLSAELIAVDGLPASGKSTFARRLADELGFAVLAIDDFNLPLTDWPDDIAPAFPFPFVRVEAFRAAVRALNTQAMCAYYPMDWEAGHVSPEPRVHYRDKPIVIEGVSVLDPVLAPLYDIRFFIESDEASILDAVFARDGRADEARWRGMFLPSDALYMATDPASRADFRVRGRGA